MAATEGAQNRAESSRRTWWSLLWPVLLGVLVAAGVGYDLTDGRDAAVVVAAAALVYLAAAAAKHRGAAWPAFGVTFVVITVAKLTETDAVPWMLALAGVALVVGLARGATRPGWGLPLQTLAMAVFGGLAILAVRAEPTVGGLVVAGLLLAHAGWDVHHHRKGRVVARSLARFCAVLDTLLAVIVAAVALSA